MKQTAETKYKNAFHRERPEHGLRDDFSLRHPKMELGQRAKIFSPFSALRGFEEAIESKLETYVSKKELTEEDQMRINLVLLKLVDLTESRRHAQTGPVIATVTFYVPCGDENNEAYGLYGQYRTRTGTVQKIDPLIRKSIQIDGKIRCGSIRFS